MEEGWRLRGDEGWRWRRCDEGWRWRRGGKWWRWRGIEMEGGEGGGMEEGWWV